MVLEITPSDIWAMVRDIREIAPVVHNITNYVAMNNTANALLAIGASPVMAHAEEEMKDMVDISSSLVINIGTLSKPWIRAMFKAAHQAKKRGIPIVLDPVGAGATVYRTQTARELIRKSPPAIIRGNSSEIMALLDDRTKTKGVDSSTLSEDALTKGRQLNGQYGSVVCISGETDYIVDGNNSIKIKNGHPMMARVTGLGCTATALYGAFVAVSSSLQAAVGAMAVMGIAGEIAAQRAQGPGSLQMHFIDALYHISEKDIHRYIKMEVS